MKQFINYKDIDDLTNELKSLHSNITELLNNNTDLN